MPTGNERLEYEQFLANWGGFDVRRADHDWFKLVHANHNDLRKFLGIKRDEIIGFDFDIENKEGTVSRDKIRPIFSKLLEIIPEYIDQYEISVSDFVLGYLPEYKNIKITKHVSTYLDRNNIDDSVRDVVEKLMSKLGEIYNAPKVDKKTLEVWLITDPKGFYMLGHYNECDSKSCFKQTALNDVHKYILGQTKNTFVGLVIENIDNNQKTVGRFWGIVEDDFRVFNVCNVYLNPHYYAAKEYTEVGIGVMMHNILKPKENDKLMCRENAFSVKGVYHNAGYNMTFSLDTNKPKKDDKKKIIIMNSEGLDKFRKCHYHHYEFGQSNVNYVDGLTICDTCIQDRARECNICKEHCLKYQTVITEETGKSNIVCHRCISSLETVICRFTELRSLKKLTEMTDTGRYGHIFYIKYYGFLQCKTCNRYYDKTTGCKNCKKQTTISASLTSSYWA